MDTEEKLITIVQQYQCLYNTKSKYYSDKHAKNNAWEKVSAEMNIPAAECQKLWKKIRDSYRKSLRSRQNRSGSARTNDRPIKFEKELEFLTPYIQDRPQISNLDNSHEESYINSDSESHFEQSNNTESPSVPSPRPRSSISNFTSTSYNEQQPPKMSNLLYEEYLKSKENEKDPTMSFFITMGRTVRLMPHKIQAQIKGKIFQIVNEAEIMLSDEYRGFNYTGDNSYSNSPSSFAPPPPPPPVDNIYCNQSLSVAPPAPPSTVDNSYSNENLCVVPPSPPSTVNTSLAANDTDTAPKSFSYIPTKIFSKKSTVNPYPKTKSYERLHAADNPPSPYIPSSVSRPQTAHTNMSEWDYQNL